MYKRFARVLYEIKTNPRKCDVCGCTETVENIILKYKGDIFLCDDCLLTYDFGDFNGFESS